MPWEEINLETHQCQKPEYEPELKVQGIGSVWACPLCYKRWRLMQIYGTNGASHTIWDLMVKDAPRARYR